MKSDVSMIRTFGLTKEEISNQLKLFGDSTSFFQIVESDCGIDILINSPDNNQISLFREAQEELDQKVQAIIKLLGQNVYSTDNTTLEEQIIKLAKKLNLSIATAESFTGGGVVSKLVRVSGASEVVKAGIVAYSEQAKISILNVPFEVIASKTAVSEDTVYHMATGVLNLTKATVVVATTGYAGPTGDMVGRCYMGVGDINGIHVYKYNFLGDRAQITKQGINCALFNLYNHIKNMVDVE